MKTRIFSLALVFVVMMGVVLTGCSGSGGKTVQSYIDQQAEQIESVKESVADMMDIEVEAKDEDTLAYTYTLKTEINGNPEETAAALEQNLNAQASMFEGILEEMRTFGIKSPKVMLTYYDMNGTELFSKTFE